MGKLKDMTGELYHNLRVIRFSEIRNNNAHWICECLLCGSETEVSRPNLRSGNTQDCGCMRSAKISDAATIHGFTKSPTWNSWSKMTRRIKLGSDHSPVYGTISVCERWKDFRNFLDDMGERPEGMTLDRIDNTKGYYKENCRWATQAEQNRNKSNNVILGHNGESMCLTDWAKKLGIYKSTISRRIKRGLPVDKVLYTGGRVGSKEKW